MVIWAQILPNIIAMPSHQSHPPIVTGKKWNRWFFPKINLILDRVTGKVKKGSKMASKNPKMPVTYQKHSKLFIPIIKIHSWNFHTTNLQITSVGCSSEITKNTGLSKIREWGLSLLSLKTSEDQYPFPHVFLRVWT